MICTTKDYIYLAFRAFLLSMSSSFSFLKSKNYRQNGTLSLLSSTSSSPVQRARKKKPDILFFLIKFWISSFIHSFFFLSFVLTSSKIITEGKNISSAFIPPFNQIVAYVHKFKKKILSFIMSNYDCISSNDEHQIFNVITIIMIIKNSYKW